MDQVPKKEELLRADSPEFVSSSLLWEWIEQDDPTRRNHVAWTKEADKFVCNNTANGRSVVKNNDRIQTGKPTACFNFTQILNTVLNKNEKSGNDRKFDLVRVDSPELIGASSPLTKWDDSTWRSIVAWSKEAERFVPEYIRTGEVENIGNAEWVSAATDGSQPSNSSGQIDRPTACFDNAQLLNTDITGSKPDSYWGKLRADSPELIGASSSLAEWIESDDPIWGNPVTWSEEVDPFVSECVAFGQAFNFSTIVNSENVQPVFRHTARGQNVSAASQAIIEDRDNLVRSKRGDAVNTRLPARTKNGFRKRNQ